MLKGYSDGNSRRVLHEAGHSYGQRPMSGVVRLHGEVGAIEAADVREDAR